MNDEPLIVRVVARGPLLGSRTVTPAWFISEADVTAAWSERPEMPLSLHQSHATGFSVRKASRSHMYGQRGRTGA